MTVEGCNPDNHVAQNGRICPRQSVHSVGCLRQARPRLKGPEPRGDTSTMRRVALQETVDATTENPMAQRSARCRCGIPCWRNALSPLTPSIPSEGPNMVTTASPTGTASTLPLLFAVAVLGLVGPFVFLVSPVIAGQLALQWHWSATDIGLLMFAELAGASLVTFPAIFLLRRLAWRPLALTTSVLFAVIALASAWVAAGGVPLEWLFPLRFLGGAAGGLLSVVCVMAAGASPVPHRAFAFWTAGQTVSAGLGLFGLPLLFTFTGMSGLYLVLAAMSVLGLVTLGGLPTRWQPHVHISRMAKPLAAGLSLAAIFCYYVAISGAWAFVGVPGGALGLSETDIGNLTSAALFTAIIGSAIASLVGDGAHRTPATLCFFALLLGSVALIALTGQTLIYIAAVLVLQTCWSFLVPTLMATLADNDGKGNLMIVSNMIIGGGASIGPVLAGAALEHGDSYTAVAVVGTALLILAAGAFLIARLRGNR